MLGSVLAVLGRASCCYVVYSMELEALNRNVTAAKPARHPMLYRTCCWTRDFAMPLQGAWDPYSLSQPRGHCTGKLVMIGSLQ